MKILSIIGITLLTLIIGVVVLINFIPLNWLEIGKSKDVTLGATITTINATDLIKDSRATINTNFSNLNTDKLEISTFYATTSHSNLATLNALASIGTITTGVWNGTAVTVAYGGTGSTTLASNQILLGNGTGNIKTVSGFGTSGQFLQSQGAAAAPTWVTTSVDTAANYTWTGTHLFSSNLAGSSTVQFAAAGTTTGLRLNGIQTTWPSAQGASSTVLTNNGNGDFFWTNGDWGQIAEVTSTTTSTTVNLPNIPNRTHLRVVIYVAGKGVVGQSTLLFNGDPAANYGFRYNAFSNTSTAPADVFDNGSGTSSLKLSRKALAVEQFTLDVTNYPTLFKTVTGSGAEFPDSNDSPITIINGGVWSNTTASIHTITLKTLNPLETFSAGTRITVWGKRD